MGAETTENEGSALLLRLRSTTLLVALVIALGAATAVVLGAAIVAAVALFNSALG